MKYFVWQFLITILLCLGTPCFAQSPPANDDFINRLVLPGGSTTFTGTLTHATLEPHEPAGSMSFPGNPFTEASDNCFSVWWSWTASTSGLVTLDIPNFSRSDLNFAGFDAWTGTHWFQDFIFVDSILAQGPHPYFSFSATAGTTYHLRAIGTNSAEFTVRITETNLPIILVEPASRTVSVNGSTFFSVLAAGAPPEGPRLSYQWRLNGIDLPGETFPILSLDNLTTNQSGAYSVIVSNAFGGTLSEAAILKVAETVTPPQLMFVGTSNGMFNFKILGDLGRLYRVESSTDLVNWVEEKSFPGNFIYPGQVREKNGLVYNDKSFFSVPQAEQGKFYRTTNYSPSNEICINNLGIIRCAKDFWAAEYGARPWFTAVLDNLAPYLRNGVPLCPLDFTGFPYFSYSLREINANPNCHLSLDHLLESPEY
jgi:hypothetical protein